MTLDDYLNSGEQTPGELAAKVGISEASLSRIRRGEQNTTRDVMLRIIAASGEKVTADGLLGRHVTGSDGEWPIAAGGKSDENTAPETGTFAASGAGVPHAPFSPTSSETNGQSSSKRIDASPACSAGPSSTDSEEAEAA